MEKNKIMFIFGVLISTVSIAGTTLVPETKPTLDVERFPESRFGAPPAAVKSTVFESYTANQVSEVDEIATAQAASEVVRSPSSVSTGSVANEFQAASMRRKGVQEVALIAGDLGFFPKVVFVSRDVPVRMYVTGSSKNTLCIMMDSFQVRKQIKSQRIEEITFTPTQPGKFRYYCPVNGMEGTMIVKELTQAEEN